ncbi:glycosyltransferase family 2 protein [Marinimicrobium locisalis]|uniref:glycosyltransferase family 2 protein n=1 Tax=Marinimicrobium locisalis TaxID=546022 RepID=UPI00322193A3
MNPLVHYFAYGKGEGRLPFLGAAAPMMNAYPLGTSPVDKLNQIMWNGFDHWAYPQLLSLASRGDPGAAWYLATWHYAHGSTGEALRWVKGLNSEGDFKTLVGLTKCYTVLGETTPLRALVGDALSNDALANILPYAQANAAENESQRLNAINRIYRRNDLQAILPKDPEQPLSLANLSGEAATGEKAMCTEQQRPLVSVVMAAYNASSTIEMAIGCVLAQTWQELEVIVVDDASTDDTLERVQGLATRDHRVRYLVSDVNSGAYAARNRGMACVKGEFVTVHDSDDWSHPQKIEKQMVPLLQSPRLMASYSWWVRVTDDLQCLGSWVLGNAFLEVNQSSWLVRRSALAKTGLWDEVKVSADVEFATRMQHHFGYAALESVLPTVPLAFSLTDAGSLTRTKATHISTQFHGLRRQYSEAFSWWHRQCEGRPVMPPASGAGNMRPFPTPLGNLRGEPLFFEAVLVSNFAVHGEELASALAFLEGERKRHNSICLLHWPERNAWHGNPIADGVFEWCHAHGVHFAHFGMKVHAPTVVLSHASLWQRPPTRSVQLTEVENLIVHEGELGAQRTAVLAYFRAGGVNLEASNEDP